ncbi:Histone-lysine N-methyltransferase SETMAR, partial [Harpegnathos saltator]
GNSSPSISTINKWAAEFQRGHSSIFDDERSGRPKTSTTEEIIEKIHSLKAMEIHSETVNVLGKSASSKTMVCKWALKFQRGRTSIEDDPRSGRPKSASIPEIIEQIHVIVSEDPSVTTREIAHTI